MFDDSSANRIEASLAQVNEVLLSAKNGWLMKYYPNANQKYGGYNLFLYFSADGKNKIQPGYPKYSDINGDGVINDDDRTMIGRGEALHTGGFTNNFSYKGFDLSVFLQWSYGNDILNANRLIFESTFNKRKNLNQFASYADRWSMDNQESNILSLIHI